LSRRLLWKSSRFYTNSIKQDGKVIVVGQFTHAN